MGVYRHACWLSGYVSNSLLVISSDLWVYAVDRSSYLCEGLVYSLSVALSGYLCSVWLAGGFPCALLAVGVRGSLWLPLAPLWLPLAPSGSPGDSLGHSEQLEYAATFGSFGSLVAPSGSLCSF